MGNSLGSADQENVRQACRAVAIDDIPVLAMKNSDGTVGMLFDTDGNLFLYRGEEHSCAGLADLTPSSIRSEWIFNVAVGGWGSETVALYRSDTGDLYLKGGMLQRCQTLTPNPALSELIIRDGDEQVIAILDANGNLSLKGVCYMNP